MIGFIFYELTSKYKWREAEGLRQWMNAEAMRPKEWPLNERTKAVYEWTNKPNKRKMDQWHAQTFANPATQQMAEIHLFLYETKGKTPGQLGLEQRKVFLSGWK